MDAEEYRTMKDMLIELKLIRTLLQRQNELSLEAHRVLKRMDQEGLPETKETK